MGGANALAHRERIDGAVADCDLHGIDRHHFPRGDVLGGLGFECLGLVLGFGQPRAGDLLGPAAVTREIDYYNLDVIISVGYRVKSKRGTQFRIWATRTLREHLLRGYTLNEKRLREKGLNEIEQAVGLLTRTLTQHALVTDEGRAVLEVVQQYTRAWRLLLESIPRGASAPAQAPPLAIFMGPPPAPRQALGPGRCSRAP